MVAGRSSQSRQHGRPRRRRRRPRSTRRHPACPELIASLGTFNADYYSMGQGGKPGKGKEAAEAAMPIKDYVVVF